MVAGSGGDGDTLRVIVENFLVKPKDSRRVDFEHTNTFGTLLRYCN